MRHVNKTNIRKALRKSWDSGNYEDVNDEWMVEFGRNYGYLGVTPMCPLHVRMWNHKTGEELLTNVGGCCSMTEYVNYATECLLNLWEERNEKLRIKKFWALLDVWMGGMVQWAGRQYYVTFEADEDTPYDELRRRAINECRRIHGDAEYGVFALEMKRSVA